MAKIPNALNKNKKKIVIITNGSKYTTCAFYS